MAKKKASKRSAGKAALRIASVKEVAVPKLPSRPEVALSEASQVSPIVKKFFVFVRQHPEDARSFIEEKLKNNEATERKSVY